MGEGEGSNPNLTLTCVEEVGPLDRDVRRTVEARAGLLRVGVRVGVGVRGGEWVGVWVGVRIRVRVGVR